MESTGPYLTVYQLAEEWGVSPATVRREIRRGALRATRFGRQCVRVSFSEAERFARERTGRSRETA